MLFGTRYKKFIVKSHGLYGTWGAGNTRAEAEANRLKAGGKKRDETSTYFFQSDFRFAPANRDANDNEADAYISADGTMHWSGCSREEIV